VSAILTLALLIACHRWRAAKRREHRVHWRLAHLHEAHDATRYSLARVEVEVLALSNRRDELCDALVALNVPAVGREAVVDRRERLFGKL
jgi:hypothetical protein